MSSLPFMLGALCVFVIAYRYYSAFLSAKVVCLDSTRVTPAYQLEDGSNYTPTSKWVLFGHHFAAIAGAGPLIGPVLAAQFGFLPGFLWILIGVVLAGAVQDFIILFASTRRGGRSLVEIAREEIGPAVSLITAIAVLFIIIVALAGLGMSVVNALQQSAWGVFAIGASIPLALFMGWYLSAFRPGKTVEASAIGVTGLILAVVFGRWIPSTPLGPILTLSHNGVVGTMAIYGFVASVLPVWMLLVPRDYLSSYMKIGTIALLVLGILLLNPPIHLPMISAFVHGGGPIIPGKVFPFVFVTIACGSISGFHALVGSGTTPKMIRNEMDIRPIGYGAMLMEGLVGITALIACSALYPGDYFALNVAPAKFAAMHLNTVNLTTLAQQVGEPVAGRIGGAVSLAIGMAQVFTALPGMSRFMSYWYHFAILFEALFILTTIDAGTRVGTIHRPRISGARVRAIRSTGVVAGFGACEFACCRWMGLFYFDGQRVDDLADVRNRQSIARRDCSGRWKCGARANGKEKICMGHTGSALVCGHDDTHRRMGFDTRQLFAARASTRKSFLGYLNASLTATIMVFAVLILISAMWKIRPLLSGRETLAKR